MKRSELNLAIMPPWASVGLWTRHLRLASTYPWDPPICFRCLHCQLLMHNTFSREGVTAE